MVGPVRKVEGAHPQKFPIRGYLSDHAFFVEITADVKIAVIRSDNSRCSVSRSRAADGFHESIAAIHKAGAVIVLAVGQAVAVVVEAVVADFCAGGGAAVVNGHIHIFREDLFGGVIRRERRFNKVEKAVERVVQLPAFHLQGFQAAARGVQFSEGVDAEQKDVAARVTGRGRDVGIAVPAEGALAGRRCLGATGQAFGPH